MMQSLAIFLLQVVPALASQAEWRQFSPPDSSFSVAFPGGPETSETQTMTRRRLLTTRNVYFNDSIRNSFQVSWTEYERARPLRLEDSVVTRMVEALAKTNQAVRVDSGPLSATDPNTRPAMLRLPDGRTMLVRFSIVGNRVYQLMAEFEDGETAIGRAQRFLQSFHPLR